MAGNVFQFNPRQPAHSSLGQVPEKPLAKGAVPRPSVGYATLDDIQPDAGTHSGYAGPSGPGGYRAPGFGGGAGVGGGGGLGVGAFNNQGASSMFDASPQEPAPAAAPAPAQVPATQQQGWIGWTLSGAHRAAKALPWWAWAGIAVAGTWTAYRYGTGKPIIPFRGKKRKNGTGKPARVVIDAVTSDVDDDEE